MSPALGSSYQLHATADQADWRLLVRRFRSLRATLVAHADVSLFAAQVYLLSTDVSLCAADHAETLKSLQALVQDLLPELIHRAGDQDAACSSSARSMRRQVSNIHTPTCSCTLHALCRRPAGSATHSRAPQVNMSVSISANYTASHTLYLACLQGSSAIEPPELCNGRLAADPEAAMDCASIVDTEVTHTCIPTHAPAGASVPYLCSLSRRASTPISGDACTS